MSSLGERFLEHAARLGTRRVPNKEFYELFDTNEQDVVAFGLRVLQQALAEQDSLLVHFGSYVGHRFGFNADYLPALRELAEAPWHDTTRTSSRG